jgi:hypothetical protein
MGIPDFTRTRPTILFRTGMYRVEETSEEEAQSQSHRGRRVWVRRPSVAQGTTL